VTHYLKTKAGVPRIIVQVNNHQEEEAIKVIGADVTVFPERDSARHMVAALANPHLTDIFELGGDAEIVEIEVPTSFVGPVAEGPGAAEAVPVPGGRPAPPEGRGRLDGPRDRDSPRPGAPA